MTVLRLRVNCRSLCRHGAMVGLAPARRGNREDEEAEVQRLRGLVRGLNTECYLKDVHGRGLERMLAEEKERCQEENSALRAE